MDDDRILFCPPLWAPDPDVLARWPAVRVFLQRVEELWPIDFVRWPTIKGEPRLAANRYLAIKAAVTSVLRQEHHVVAYACGERIIAALAVSQPRSLTATSFFARRETMAAAGEGLAFDALQAATAAGRKPAQLLPSIFQGADPAYVASLLVELEEARDQAFLEASSRDPSGEDVAGITLDIPALYLASAAPLPGRQAMESVFRRFLPRARTDQLAIWGVRMHEEAAGEEFADKVIAFVQEVIAEREKAG